MPRASFSGFKDPRRRPRYILWTGAVLLLFAAFMITVLGITSTKWFCAEGCHKVQDDTILAYEASAHANISCMACHMPVGADPVTFLLHKAEALGELYLTVTGNYELPLNGESELAYEMQSEQCTQCHTLFTVTPAAGIVIDHEIHTSRGVECTVCHNRVAHVENFELTLEDPTTGEPNQPHDDFQVMTACFRCHSQEEVRNVANGESAESAPGDCDACHTPEFDLVPESHDASGFVRQPGERRAVHAELAREEGIAGSEDESPEGEDAAAEPGAEGEGGGETEGGGEEHEVAGFVMKPLHEIDSCGTCHADQFCTDCHGVDIPHPEDFDQTHPPIAEKNPKSCENCHLKEAAGMNVCDECHHSAGDTTQAWLPQHPTVVRGDGAEACFDCHDPRFCSACHVNLSQ